MITVSSCDRCLSKYFIDHWISGEGAPLSLVITQNEEIQTVKPDNPWVRFSVDLFSFLEDSLGVVGNRRMLREGIIAVQIFVPAMSRTKLLNELVSTVISIFEGKKYEGVIFRALTIDKIDEPDDSIWFGKVVKIPFEFTEIK